MRALAWGAFASALVGVAGFVVWLGGTETFVMSGDRLCGTMTGDPNIYGSLLGVGMIATAADRRASTTSRLLRCAVMLAALLATGSRSALIGTGAAFVTYAAIRKRDRLAVGARAAYALVAMGALAALFLVSDRGSAAAERVWAHHWRTFTVEGRLDLYHRAFEQFADHPLTGLGIGGFRELNTFQLRENVTQFVVHNTYLWALVDLGIAGGLLVAGLIAAGFARCVRAAHGCPPAESAAVVGAGLAAMAVFNLFIDGFYQRHFWVLLACATGMPVYRAIRDRSAAARRSDLRTAA